MTTETMQQLSADDLHAANRQRQRLLTTVEEAKEDFIRQQSVVRAAGEKVANLHDETAWSALSAARDRLIELNSVWLKATREADDWIQSHPTKEELDARIEQIQAAELAKQQRESKEALQAKIGELLPHIAEIERLEAEALTILNKAPHGSFRAPLDARDLTDILGRWAMWKEKGGERFIRNVLQNKI